MVYVSERLIELMPERASESRGYVSEIAPGAYEVAGSGLMAYLCRYDPPGAIAGQPPPDFLRDLRPGSPGNLFHVLPGGLSERFDFSGHDGHGPHINYDLWKAKHEFTVRALGDLHHIDLE